MALAGVVTSLAVLVAATLIGDVSIFSINVVNMLGIGLGIDYGLLMVSRFREERGRGRELHDAVVQTVATAGKTVVFSALTVAVAMCGLFVFGLPDPLLVRHRRPRRRPALHGRRRHAAARRPRRGRRQDPPDRARR